MLFHEARKIVLEFIKDNFDIDGKIVKLFNKDEKWIAHFEVIEEAEYMRKFGQTDIVGLYEVELDSVGEILGYKRVYTRERSDLDPA